MNQVVLAQQLIRLYQARQYAQVISLFVQHTSLKQCDVNAGLCYLGSLRFTGDIKKSLTGFSTLLKRFAGVPALHNSYANALITDHQYELASKQLKLALRADVNFVDAYINLGRVQSLQGQYEYAVKSYVNAKRLAPNNINIRIGLGSALSKSGNSIEAIGVYQDVLETSINTLQDVRVSINLAAIYREQQDYQKALEILLLGENTFQNSSQWHNACAANYALLNQHQQAQSHYQKALQLAPSDAQLQIEYAHYAWAQGHAEPFEALLQSLHDPIKQTALFFAAIDLFINAEQYALAQPIIEQALNALPNDPDILMLAARNARLLNDIDRAKGLIDKATKLSKNPISINIINEQGYIELALGNGKRAETLYRNLQKRQPLDQGWWTLYSSAIKLQGKQEDYAQLCDYNLVHTSSILTDKSPSYLSELTTFLAGIHANTRHPIGQSLRNGTQTYEDIFDNRAEVIQQLKSWVLEQATNLSMRLPLNGKHPFLSRVGQALEYTGSWSVNLQCGGYHTSHFHPQGWLSGVFYVDIPTAVNHNGEGWLQFGVPEISQLNLPADYVVKPENGLLVLFPSFMWHGTRTFTSGKRRMTVAFDIIPRT